MAQTSQEHGTYQLLIYVKRSVTVKVGKLGEFEFLPGYYVYTGSAKRGMAARLARHMRKEKTQRWHIDYLLSQSDVEIIQTRTSATPECELNQQQEGEIIVPGFGSSDCTSDCGSHLKYTRGTIHFCK